jgi:hypothetical protein
MRVPWREVEIAVSRSLLVGDGSVQKHPALDMQDIFYRIALGQQASNLQALFVLKKPPIYSWA